MWPTWVESLHNTILGPIREHLLLNRHTESLGVTTNDFCRSCWQEEGLETLMQFLRECLVLQSSRLKSLETAIGRDFSEISGKRYVNFPVCKQTFWLSVESHNAHVKRANAWQSLQLKLTYLKAENSPKCMHKNKYLYN